MYAQEDQKPVLLEITVARGLEHVCCSGVKKESPGEQQLVTVALLGLRNLEIGPETRINIRICSPGQHKQIHISEYSLQ